LLTVLSAKEGKDVKTAGIILKLLNGLYSLVLTVILLGVVGFSGYVLWDGNQIAQSAMTVQRSVQVYRPTVEDKEEKALSFQDLQKLNPDVCAWLSLSNTNIDYPVLQGKTNYDYLSMNVYKQYDLTGSIFLDTRNSRFFEDSVQVLYGHSLGEDNDGIMFSHLKKYEDASFFENNREGMLLSPDGVWKLHIFAFLIAPYEEDLIFDPEYAAENRSLLLDYVGEHAVRLDTETLTALRGGTGKILTMTTCTDEVDSDDRRVVLAWMEDAA
jgi:sortase B